MKKSIKEKFIPLKEAESLFEKFKEKYTNTNKNISMSDCLLKNHKLIRLPLYINWWKLYANQSWYKNILNKIYVNFNDLNDFFHRELILFEASDYYYDPCFYCKEEWKDC